MIRSGVLLAALACMSGGCRTKEQPHDDAEATAPAGPAAKHVDQVGPDELGEGAEKAFGLPIPRRMRVTARFSDEVFASGPLTPEQLANYVRERVVGAHVETGAVKTVFAEVTVKGAPPTPLRIEVNASMGGGCELFVKDESRLPAPAGLTPDDAWKSVGMSPDGRLLDPTHLR